MLRNEDPELFKNFIRMTASDFDLLVEMIKPCIEKEDTKFRKSISPTERLAVILRFLATGDSNASLTLSPPQVPYGTTKFFNFEKLLHKFTI